MDFHVPCGIGFSVRLIKPDSLVGIVSRCKKVERSYGSEVSIHNMIFSLSGVSLIYRRLFAGKSLERISNFIIEYHNYTVRWDSSRGTDYCYGEYTISFSIGTLLIMEQPPRA